MDLTDALIYARHPQPIDVEIDRSGDRSEAQMRESLATLLAERVDGNGIWIFSYGSLLWKPEPEVIISKQRSALVRGLHRRFCLWQWRSRGSPQQPCLMMALDGGGACRSMVQWVPGADIADAIWPLWCREMRGHGYVARWVKASTAEGSVQALTFVANRAGPRYTGELDLDAAAAYLASGCGPRGACAQYLRNTVLALDAVGIRDRNLWTLQSKVAALLEATAVTVS